MSRLTTPQSPWEGLQVSNFDLCLGIFWFGGELMGGYVGGYFNGGTSGGSSFPQKGEGTNASLFTLVF